MVVRRKSSTVADSSTSRSLRDHDFVTLTKSTSQTCGLVYGASGCGKSTLVLRYCPGPIAFFSFDGRADDQTLEEMESGKIIHFARVDFPEDISGMEDKKAMLLARKATDTALHNFNVAIDWAHKGKIRTICFDTGTELDEILTIRYKGNLGVISNDFGASKGQINRQWLTMFRRARCTPAHLIIIARAKEEWVKVPGRKGKQPSGIFEPVIASKVVDAVDWKVYMKVYTVQGAPRFSLQVTKAGPNISQMMKEYKSSQWGEVGPFVHLCSKMYPRREIEFFCDDLLLERLKQDKAKRNNAKEVEEEEELVDWGTENGTDEDDEEWG